MKMTSIRSLAWVVLLLACTTATPRQTTIFSASPRDDELLNAERDWVRATMRQDADAFAGFLDDDWVGLVDGKLIEKAQWANEVRAGTSRRDSIRLSNLKVRFPRRNVAVVTGSYVNRQMRGNAEYLNAGTYINTWARIDGRWQLVSSGFETVLTGPSR